MVVLRSFMAITIAMQHRKTKPRNKKPSNNRKPQTLPKELEARQVALRCLLDVIKKKQPLDVVFSTMRRNAGLSGEDKSFSEQLVRRVLKRYYPLAPYIDGFLAKPYDALPVQAQLLLCIGTVQIHEMNVPTYAAVNTTVELAKYSGQERLSGMINVVLKKISQTPPKLSDDALMTAMPSWYVNRLIQDYGEEASAIIASSLSDIHYVDLTLKPSLNKADYAARLSANALGGDAIRLAAAPSIAGLDGYEVGDWWVQDVAASSPIYGIKHLLEGKRVLDAGAAPGGKTMQLASYGANVTALDRSSKRLQRLQENLNRTQLAANVVCADMLDYEPVELFDVIVLDAPCSATGTMRRNPDILYHRDDDAIDEVALLQTRLLEAMSQWLKPEGYLLYCSCSLFKQEGEGQIEAFLSGNNSFERAAFDGLDGTLINQHGEYRSLPNRHAESDGMDGFFAALLKRI